MIKWIRLKPDGLGQSYPDSMPVTHGVPFAAGELSAGTHVRVVDAIGDISIHGMKVHV